MKSRIKLFCEGKLEAKYFSLLKEKYLQNIEENDKHFEVIYPKESKNKPKDLLEKARNEIEENEKYIDQIYLIFDMDEHPNVRNVFDSVSTLNKTNKTKIIIIFSNVCFELWILLCFEYGNFNHDDCQKLKQYIKNNHMNIKISHLNESHTLFNEDLIKKGLVNNKKLTASLKFELKEENKMPYELEYYTNVDLLIKEFKWF